MSNPASRSAVINTVFLCGLAMIAVNTLLYVSKAANPLIVADDWHFLDTVIRNAAAGDLVLEDLFSKRGAWDHSQPLRKLILLFHYRYFDLDYSVGAIIGVLAAFANLGIFWKMIQSGDAISKTHRKWLALVFAALAAVYLSLNAAVTFTWPLLTLSYTSHLFVLMFLWSAWIGFRNTKRWQLLAMFVSALAMDLVADDTGLIATIAAVLALSLVAVRERRWSQGVKSIAVIASAYVAYWALVWSITSHAGNASASSGFGIRNLFMGLFNQGDGIFRGITVPLTASIAHRVQLKQIIGPNTTIVELTIASILMAAHLWFWWRALRGRNNLAAFVAVALMFLFYGLVAGILLGRVSLRGADYLWQPRYVLIFEWNVIALLLMGIAQSYVSDRKMTGSFMSRINLGQSVLAMTSVMLLVLQIPLSHNTWTGLKFVSAYQQRMATKLGTLAENPTDVAQGCAPQLIVCRYAPKQRADTIRFLQAHRLNVFSPAFRARNRLYLGPESLSK